MNTIPEPPRNETASTTEASSGLPVLKTWQELLVALSCATLLYGGQIRMSSNPRNRMHDFWVLDEGLSYLIGILLLGAAIFLFRSLIARRAWGRIFDYGFWLLIGGGFLTALIGARNALFHGLYFLFMALLAVAWFRPRWQLNRRLERAALFISPFIAVAAFQLLGYAPWGTPKETVKLPFSDRPANPVYVFIFDEWSYRMSTKNGEWLPFFKNLRELSGQSFFFEDAQSAGRDTFPSIPMFLFQTSDELIVGQNEFYWKRDGQLLPTVSEPSLFSLAKEHDYNSLFIGFHIPERKLLGEQADYVNCRPYTKVAQDLSQRIIDNAVNNLDTTNDPAVRTINWGLKRTVRSRASATQYWIQLVNDLQKESLSLIGETPRNTFLVSHLPIPHAPFIFNEKGEAILEAPIKALVWDEEGYLRHLGFLDHVIGNLVEKLKASGKFEDALIIITSDHSYREDPNEKDRQHVPLLVKLPGQREGVKIKEKFPAISLKPVVAAVMEGRVDEARARLNQKAGLAKSR